MSHDLAQLAYRVEFAATGVIQTVRVCVCDCHLVCVVQLVAKSDSTRDSADFNVRELLQFLLDEECRSLALNRSVQCQDNLLNFALSDIIYQQINLQI